MVSKNDSKKHKKQHSEVDIKHQKEVPISVHLDIRVIKGRVITHLIFHNRSKEPQYLDPNRCGARGIMNAHFRIFCCEEKVPYTGPLMLKSRPPRPEEYIRLEPDGHFEATLDITDVYGWLPGEHEYEAYYREYHSNPYKHVLYLLKSNVVLFRYFRQPLAAK